MNNQSKLYYGGDRANIKNFIPSKYTKVLEIGCGEGRFKNNLKTNCEYWGVEPHMESYEVAVQNLDKVFHGTYMEVAKYLPQSYFDLIICNDVIEHMPDHDEFLRKIKQKMKPNAYIVGSIPNVRFFPNLLSLIFDKDWKYQDEGILDRTHLRFFTEKSLQRTLNEHGYIIEKFGGINNLKYRLTSLKKIIKYLSTRILGIDTLSLQFAFCVKYKTNKIEEVHR